MNEQAVLVHLPSSSDPPDAIDVSELEDALIEAIDEAGVGQLDGNEIDLRTGDVVLYTYGPDANHLANTIVDVLMRQPVRPGTHLIRRYGGPGAHENRLDVPIVDSD